MIKTEVFVVCYSYNLMDEKDFVIPFNKSLIVLVHGYRSGTKNRMLVDLGKCKSISFQAV